MYIKVPTIFTILLRKGFRVKLNLKFLKISQKYYKNTKVCLQSTFSRKYIQNNISMIFYLKQKKNCFLSLKLFFTSVTNLNMFL